MSEADERYIDHLEAIRQHQAEQLSNVQDIAARAYVHMVAFRVPRGPVGVGDIEPIEYRCGACGGKQKTGGICIEPMCVPAQVARALAKETRVERLSALREGQEGKVPESDSALGATPPAPPPEPAPPDPAGVRSKRFDDTTGALTWNYRSAMLHPDRCMCQDETTPHKHYPDAPYACARCGNCKGYRPAVAAPPEPLKEGSES